MKVLVTGANGQVGRASLQQAPKLDVLALGHAQLDITNETAVRDTVLRFAPQVIVNTAAYTAVDRAESEPESAWRVNAQGPRWLALAARELGARMIHFSTDFVFDGAASSPYPPDATTHPLNVYGHTKRAGEEAVLETLGDRALILRTAWVYAPVGHNFLCTMIRLMTQKKAVRVVADQVGTPTAARTLGSVVWQLVQRPEISGCHHWTDAGVASWYDFATAIAEEATVLGLLPDGVTVTPIGTLDYQTPARRPAYSVLDKSTLIKALGQEPAHWRQVLRAVLAELHRA